MALRTGPYSYGEVALLKAMYLGGKSDREIAKALNRSLSSVKDQRSHQGLMALHHIEPASMHQKACTEHLLDLLRAYGGGTVGEAKARYRARNEHDVPEGYQHAAAFKGSAYLPAMSFCGSSMDF